MSKIHRATSVFLDVFNINPAKADLALLGLVAQEYAALPWENLSKFLKKREIPRKSAAGPFRLSEETIEDYVRLGTGGTCFSLTNALQRITLDLGFRSGPAMADMRHGDDIHCVLLVELDGRRYLLDPGYLVAEPVPLERGVSVQVRMPGHRLEYRALPDGDQFDLYTVNERGEEIFRYRLKPWVVDRKQFFAHWSDSFDSPGMNGLHLNMLTSSGRLSAHNLNLRIDTGRGKKNIKLRNRYVELVSRHFGLDPSLVGRAYDEWERCRCRG